MEFKNNPTLGNETSEVKIRQLEDKIKTLTQNIGDLQTEINYLHNDFEAENVQVNSLPNAEVIESDKAIGYNAQGKLIPIDVTAGTAKWETVEGRANAIKPKNNAEVIVDTVLKLQNTTEETLTGSMVLSLDEAGNVIKVNMLDVVQKKLTEGYNITISADGVISCDIKTMTFKGSVSTFADLPETGNITGDVWNVTTTNQNYCWDGESWIVVGSSVDLTNYYTKTQTDSKFAEKSNTYTKSQTDSAIESLIDDSVATTGNVWSASKTKAEIEQSKVYSTEERIIGKWIDGKPIYEKTMLFENKQFPFNNWTTVFELPENCNLLFWKESPITAEKYFLGGEGYGAQKLTNNRGIRVYQNYSGGGTDVKSYYITAQYTKTTD